MTGDFEVTVSLNPAHVELPELLTDHQAVIIREDGANTISEDGIGTGPFKLNTKDYAGVTEVVAHDDYWNGPPGVASASIIAIPEWEDRVQALLSGQIDFLSYETGNIDQFEDNT